MAGNNESDKSQQSGSERGGSGNFANDPQRAREEGKKGGQSQQGTDPKGSENTQRGGSGNFADDPERASEAGRKGGQQSHGGDSSR